MAYASTAEFVETVTEAEARALAPTSPLSAGYDGARILDALEDASAVLDTYLAGRFDTPVSPVPRYLRRAAIDLARESLSRAPREEVTAAADRARSWARDVARGLATLGSGDDPEQPPPTGGGGPAVAAAAPTFDGTLDGYMPTFASPFGDRRFG